MAGLGGRQEEGVILGWAGASESGPVQEALWKGEKGCKKAWWVGDGCDGQYLGLLGVMPRWR